MYIFSANIVDNTNNALGTIATEVSKIATPLAIVALIICGIVMMLGKEMSQVAKSWIRLIIIGMVIVLGASSAVMWLNTVLNFTV